MNTKAPILLVITLLIASCVPQKIIVNSNNLSASVGLHPENSGLINENDFQNYIVTTKLFIEQYYLETHTLQLYYSDSDTNTVIIDFISDRYVTSGQQAAGVAVTGLGIATCIATLLNPVGFTLIFWYNPKNNALVYVSLSPDLEPSGTFYPRTFISRHQFQNIEKQKDKQQEMYSICCTK